MRAWAALLLVCAWTLCSGDDEVGCRGFWCSRKVTVKWNQGSRWKPKGPQTTPFNLSGSGKKRACKKAGKTCPTRDNCKKGHHKTLERCQLCYEPRNKQDAWNCASCAVDKQGQGMGLSPRPDPWNRFKKEYSPRGNCQETMPTSAAAPPFMGCTSFGMKGSKKMDYKCMKTGVVSQVINAEYCSPNNANPLQRSCARFGPQKRRSVNIVVYAAATKYFECKKAKGSACPGKKPKKDEVARSNLEHTHAVASEEDLGEASEEGAGTLATGGRRGGGFKITASALKATKAAAKAATGKGRSSSTTGCPKNKLKKCHACSVVKNGWCEQLCFIVDDTCAKGNSRRNEKPLFNRNFRCTGGKDYKYHDDTKGWYHHTRLCCFKGCKLNSQALRAFPFMAEHLRTCDTDPAAPVISAF